MKPHGSAKIAYRQSAILAARFGVWLVVAVDVADYVLNDKATLGSLLGALTVDIPSVLIASAIGTIAGSTAAGMTTGMFAIGAFALGPLAVAFVVGVAVGFALYELDQQLHLSEKLAHAYDNAIANLRRAWRNVEHEVEVRYHQLANSQLVHDLDQEADALSRKLARQVDWIRGELVHLW